MTNNQQVRWGILGVARINRRIVPAIQASSNGIVVSIASRDLKKAKEAAEHYGIRRALGSYEALLEDEEIDVIYIPLPNSLHREWTIRTALAGKHVLCEKPLGVTSAECEEMRAICQANGVLLSEALMYRFHPQVSRTRMLIEAGIIGPVQLMHSAFSYPLSDPSNIRLQPELGGGALFDMGSYCVDASRLMVGEEPAEAFAFAKFGLETQVDETLTGALRFPSGAIAFFDCSLRAQFRQFVEVVGSEGKIDLAAPFLPRLDDVTIIVRRGDTVEKIVITGTDQYRLMVEHFNDCVLKKHVSMYSVEDAIHNMRVIDALRASANGGQPMLVSRQPDWNEPTEYAH